MMFGGLEFWCLMSLFFIGGAFAENHQPAASLRQTLSPNIVSSTHC
jgi:hypothetical protein